MYAAKNVFRAEIAGGYRAFCSIFAALFFAYYCQSYPELLPLLLVLLLFCSIVGTISIISIVTITSTSAIILLYIASASDEFRSVFCVVSSTILHILV